MTGALPVTVRGLTRRYGSVIALDGIDLDVARGEFLTLLGPSGSGKTTLLMILAGFTRPDSGSIRFGDTEMVRRPPHKRDWASCSNPMRCSRTWMSRRTWRFRWCWRRRRRRAHPSRARRPGPGSTGIAGSRRVHELSGGQRQRVALARAIVFEPGILLMDEPLSALDKKLREQMQIELRHLHRNLGTTVIYVTHDQREALTMSDRIAVIDRGRIAQIDTPSNCTKRRSVISSPTSLATARSCR